mmetsp:Transcript_42739/g.84317  ORF Transcript_42739/g.84317 Transcript_42739/m.84317 type:complete len:139 (+) Transcript_42739:299-715(+)
MQCMQALMQSHGLPPRSLTALHAPFAAYPVAHRTPPFAVAPHSLPTVCFRVCLPVFLCFHPVYAFTWRRKECMRSLKERRTLRIHKQRDGLRKRQQGRGEDRERDSQRVSLSSAAACERVLPEVTIFYVVCVCVCVCV